jgi:hypothetical protein
LSTYGPRRAWTQALAISLVTALTGLTSIAAASAGSAQPVAVASSVALRRAVTAHAAADHTLASRRKALRACLRRHPAGCRADRRAMKIARDELTSSERSIAQASRRLRDTERAGGHSAPTPGAPVIPVTPPNGSAPRSGASSGSGSITSGSAGTSGANGSPGTDSSTDGTSTDGAAGSTGPFEMGVNAGSALMYELPFIHKLGGHTARMEFAIGTPVSQIAPIVESYALDGIRPLLLASFDGTIPNSAEAQNLGSWAAELGPGGSLWKGKTFPAGTAVTSIEFGNETSYSYQYSNDTSAGYATRAQEYAIRFKEAQAAIHAADPSVGLLAQGDPGNAPGTSWMDNMFKAVPNLGQLVAGWTVHPYGPNWQSIMDEVVSSAKADGAPSSIPLDVTEWGLSTDNGRCLSNNYGFNACMTYQEAATTLESTVSAMRARYGSRLATVYLYEAHDLKATGASTEREAYFGALQSNEAPKGAYTTTVESLLSTNP